VDLDQPDQERRHAADLPRRLPAGEAVEDLRPLVPHGGHDRRALAPAAQRLGHRLDRLWHPQAVAPEAVAQLIEVHRDDTTAGAWVHRPGSCRGGIGERERGPGWSRHLPAPSSFWGNETLCSHVAGGPYRATNSGPAAPASLASPPRPERPL